MGYPVVPMTKGMTIFAVAMLLVVALIGVVFVILHT